MDKGRMARKIWPRLDGRRTAILLKLQRCRLSTVIGVITGHCIVATHARRVGNLANDFCRIYGDEEENETILHILCTCPALGRRTKRHPDDYYMEDLDELSCMDISRLSRFIGSTERFLEWGRM